MADAVYRIVEHDGGWAYKLGEVFSETFPSRKEAEAAAHVVTQEQQEPGDDETISWEDEAGVWHDETALGTDRPHAYVVDADAAPAPAETRTSLAPELRRATRRVEDYAFAAYDRGDEYARRGTRLARAGVRADPILAMLLAMICGFALSLVLRKKT